MASTTQVLDSMITQNAAVEAFLQGLPSPEDHYGRPLHALLEKIGKAIVDFILIGATVPEDHRSDTEFLLILESVQAISRDLNNLICLYPHLAHIALSLDIKANEDSLVAKQIRYLRWAAKGMNDKTSPFSSAPSAPVDHLPGTCAACGKDTKVVLRCAGCLLPTDGGSPFFTAYCNLDCQKKHWTAHRAQCRQIRSLKRATDVFDTLFRHALSVTHNPTYTVTSIKVDSGILLAECTGDYSSPTLASNNGMVGILEADLPLTPWRPFPSNLASAEDHATAILMYQQCTRPTGSARALLDMLIRPISVKLENVTVSPKNMTLPVRLAHPKFNYFSAFSCHDVLRVSLPCGARYAIDPTGLQFGWKHTMTPWEAYATRRVRRIELVKDVTNEPSFASILISNVVELGDSRFSTMAAQAPLAALIDTVVHGMHKVLRQRGTNILEILKLKDPDCAAGCANITASFKRGIDRLVHDIGLGAEPILALPPQVNRNNPVAILQLMDMLWYTADDLANASGDRDVMMAEVRRRWHQTLALAS